MKRCVFLDRDGVLNEDNPNYTFEVDKFIILPGVVEALHALKQSGYLLVVVTNQSGISQGLYTVGQMQACHDYMQAVSKNAIDAYYFSPYHQKITNSLGRKPGTLMFEKAIAKFNIDITHSWMVGDRGRDIIPARQLGIRTIQIGDEIEDAEAADFKVNSLRDAATLILQGLS